MATRQPAPNRTPTSTVIIARITEHDANEWLKNQQPSLPEGADIEDLEMKIRRSGITLSAKLHIPQLGGMSIPVEILTMPVVRNERVQMDVLDVQLGGPYAPMSGLVESMLTASMSDALDTQGFITQQGLQVSNVELEDGCMVVTGVPINRPPG